MILPVSAELVASRRAFLCWEPSEESSSSSELKVDFAVVLLLLALTCLQLTLAEALQLVEGKASGKYVFPGSQCQTRPRAQWRPSLLDLNDPSGEFRSR